MPALDESLSNPLDANADLIEEFIAQAEVSDPTRRKYRPHLLEFERWFRHNTKNPEALLLDAKPADISRFMAYLRTGNRFAASKHWRSTPRPAASTRKNILASLASFYRYLVAIELVTNDPTRSIQAPKVGTKPGLRLSLEEVRALLDVDGDPRERIQAFLLTFTGARANEIRTLRWRDVDFDNRVMQLLGKGEKYRVIDIHPRLMSELRRFYLYQADQAERIEAMRLAKADSETDYVLMTRNGKQVCRSAIIKQLKRRAARAGLHLQKTGDKENTSAVHPHALRRTFGTVLLNDGHHLDAVADVLGHRSVDTTRKHYAFSSNERRKATIHGFRV